MERPDAFWEAPPSTLQLAQDKVHVWRASLEQPEETLRQLRRLLSPDERSRAERFYFERDRRRFVVARGRLRQLIGRYLDLAPEAICFSYNAYGKPALARQAHPDAAALCFNLSHSHELALYAFTCGREVGIDVEYMRRDIEYEELARHSFSAQEQAVLHALPLDLKSEGFYNCWTRKEAYIKARGAGLAIPLDLFDVTLRPGEPAVLLASREDTREPQRWQFTALAPGPDYAGALAVEGRGWLLRAFSADASK